MEREQILSLDRRHVWRPYTSSDDHEQMDPFVVARAEGSWLIDADGTRYLDGNSSWWTCALGHRHPRLIAALERQMQHLMHCSMAATAHEQAARLAKELSDVAPPGLSRVFYSDDGSTAVEAALKMAFQYWRQVGEPTRQRFVALGGAFHGDTVGAMSIGGLPEFRDLFGSMLFDVVHAPNPAEGDAGWTKCVEAIEQLLTERSETIAAVIVEPLVQGAAGMRMWSAQNLRRLRQITHETQTLLIADEVFTGYGRTGTMWACEHADVAPDILCTAKGFSGGVFPFSATLATDAIYDGFRGGKDRAFMHGHTFCGNPLGAALAREVLAVFRDERTLDGAQTRATALRDGFNALSSIDGVRNIRSIGMVAACEVGEAGYYGDIGWRVFTAARARGAYVRPLGNTVYLCPPLNIDPAELERLLGIVHDSIACALES